MISDIKKSDTEIERMPNDFFTPQPVMGAKANYNRSIYHNFSDKR